MVLRNWIFGYELVQTGELDVSGFLDDILCALSEQTVDTDMLDVMRKLAKPSEGRSTSRKIRDSGVLPVLIEQLNVVTHRTKTLETLTTVLNIDTDNQQDAIRNFFEASEVIPHILKMLQQEDNSEIVLALDALAPFLWESNSKDMLRANGAIGLLTNIIKSDAVTNQIRDRAAIRLTALLYKTEEVTRNEIDDETVERLGKMIACCDCSGALNAIRVINWYKVRRILLDDGFLQNLGKRLRSAHTSVETAKVISTLVKDRNFIFKILESIPVAFLVAAIKERNANALKARKYIEMALVAILEYRPSYTRQVVNLGIEHHLEEQLRSSFGEEKTIVENLIGVIRFNKYNQLPARVRNQPNGSFYRK